MTLGSMAKKLNWLTSQKEEPGGSSKNALEVRRPVGESPTGKNEKE